MEVLKTKATKHFSDILTHALVRAPHEGVLLIYDRQHELTRLLVDAFAAACPEAEMLDFDSVSPVDVRQAIYGRKKGDLVVLLQSANFRLNEFRMRLEIFKLGLKTMEISHLNRMTSDQYETFVDALAYDPAYLRPLGHALKERLDRCQEVVVRCEGATLAYAGGMESAKLNIGDYAGMKNVGGTFPIGEVFTEPKDLSRVNGDIKIFAFAGMDLKVLQFDPFSIHVENGIVSAGPDAPKEFHDILDMIRQQEPAMIREFGLGLNRAMRKGRLVNDITAFERMNGLHLSLGAKHAIYRKPGLNPKKMRYHVDVFADVRSISIDGVEIFNGVSYTV